MAGLVCVGRELEFGEGSNSYRRFLVRNSDINAEYEKLTIVAHNALVHYRSIPMQTVISFQFDSNLRPQSQKLIFTSFFGDPVEDEKFQLNLYDRWTEPLSFLTSYNANINLSTFPIPLSTQFLRSKLVGCYCNSIEMVFEPKEFATMSATFICADIKALSTEHICDNMIEEFPICFHQVFVEIWHEQYEPVSPQDKQFFAVKTCNLQFTRGLDQDSFTAGENKLNRVLISKSATMTGEIDVAFDHGVANDLFDKLVDNDDSSITGDATDVNNMYRKIRIYGVDSDDNELFYVLYDKAYITGLKVGTSGLEPDHYKITFEAVVTNTHNVTVWIPQS